MKIIPARAEHMASCEAIYAHHVAHGFASFDEQAPTQGHLDEKRSVLQEQGFPFLVAVDEQSQVLGYAYAAPFRARSAYRFSAEDSIYIAPDQIGKGLAKPLFDALIAATESRGLKTLIAVIGMEQEQDPQTNSSVRAHAKVGFDFVGCLDFVGRKRDRWLKTAYMRLGLD